MLKIGNAELETNVILAPLSGCTDLPFRSIARDHGCKFAFFEMLDSSALFHGHKKTLKMLSTNENDSPIGAQILGADPAMVLDACQMILEHSKPTMMDLNCACPAKKVIRKKAGSYLLKDQKKAAKIIKKMASSLPLPVTVKLRAGFGKIGDLEGLKLAKIAQENGASAVFMHGRSASQGYAGRVDYEAIKKAKESLKIPLIASGDILTPQLAKEMLDRTGCDGILVARGAMGSPWIFGQIESHLKGEKPLSPSYEEIRQTAKRHLRLYRDFRESKEKYFLGHLRKIAMWYSKGLPYSKRAREDITGASSYDEVVGVLDKLKQLNNPWLKI